MASSKVGDLVLLYPSSTSRRHKFFRLSIVFGSGECSELGLGSREKEKPRVFVNPFLSGSEGSAFRVIQLDCGGMHTVALTSDNEIVTWDVSTAAVRSEGTQHKIADSVT